MSTCIEVTRTPHDQQLKRPSNLKIKLFTIFSIAKTHIEANRKSFDRVRHFWSFVSNSDFFRFFQNESLLGNSWVRSQNKVFLKFEIPFKMHVKISARDVINFRFCLVLNQFKTALAAKIVFAFLFAISSAAKAHEKSTIKTFKEKLTIC